MITLDRTETPPALDPRFGTVADLPGRIFIAHVRSRMEKALANELLAREIPYFLPLGRFQRFSGKKRYFTDEPVFKGFIFISGAAPGESAEGDAMDAVYATHRIWRNIEVRDQWQLKRDLLNLEQAIERNGGRIEQCPLVNGQRVRVVEGPFENLEGVIIDRADSAILILKVESCGYASMEIERAKVEPVN